AVAVIHGRRDDVRAGHSLAAQVVRERADRVSPHRAARRRRAAHRSLRVLPAAVRADAVAARAAVAGGKVTCKKITCALLPTRTSASEMAQGDGQPPSSASLNRSDSLISMHGLCQRVSRENTGTYDDRVR